MKAAKDTQKELSERDEEKPRDMCISKEEEVMGKTAKNQKRLDPKSDKRIQPNRVNESHFSETQEAGAKLEWVEFFTILGGTQQITDRTVTRGTS